MLALPTLFIAICDYSPFYSLSQSVAEMAYNHQHHHQQQQHQALVQQLCPLPPGMELGVVQVADAPTGSGSGSGSGISSSSSPTDPTGGTPTPLHATSTLSMYHTSEASKLLVDCSEFLMSAVLKDPSHLKFHMMQASFRTLTRRYVPLPHYITPPHLTSHHTTPPLSFHNFNCEYGSICLS